MYKKLGCIVLPLSLLMGSSVLCMTKTHRIASVVFQTSNTNINWINNIPYSTRSMHHKNIFDPSEKQPDFRKDPNDLLREYRNIDNVGLNQLHNSGGANQNSYTQQQQKRCQTQEHLNTQPLPEETRLNIAKSWGKCGAYATLGFIGAASIPYVFPAGITLASTFIDDVLDKSSIGIFPRVIYAGCVVPALWATGVGSCISLATAAGGCIGAHKYFYQAIQLHGNRKNQQIIKK